MTKIMDIPDYSPFTFALDETRPKLVYWKRYMDGMYVQIFSSEQDMKKFKNPAFVNFDTLVTEEKDVT